MPRTPTDSPTAPAAPHRRRTAAEVKADRRSPTGPGLDTGEDRRTLTTAGTTPKTNQDHVHNADERAVAQGAGTAILISMTVAWTDESSPGPSRVPPHQWHEG